MHVGQLVKLLEEAAQGGRLHQLLVAGRGHEQERPLGQPPGHEREEAEAHLVGPVEVLEHDEERSFAGELVIAPLSARGTLWMRRFGDHSAAFASGWMRIRGARRRRGYDRGFPISDHADWDALLRTISDTGAARVIVTHGYTAPLTRYLRDRGIDADAWSTMFEGEPED